MLRLVLAAAAVYTVTGVATALILAITNSGVSVSYSKCYCTDLERMADSAQNRVLMETTHQIPQSPP